MLTSLPSFWWAPLGLAILVTLAIFFLRNPPEPHDTPADRNLD